MQSRNEAPRYRWMALWIASALSVFFLAAPASAQGHGGDNSAVAVNEEDGATVLDLAFDIVKAGGDVVDQSNLALAYADCEDCRTIAIAVQVVLVMGDPDIVTPENVALALNN